MTPITTTLNTPKKMDRLLWHPLGGPKWGGPIYPMGVCWWWAGVGRKSVWKRFNLDSSELSVPDCQ